VTDRRGRWLSSGGLYANVVVGRSFGLVSSFQVMRAARQVLPVLLTAEAGGDRPAFGSLIVLFSLCRKMTRPAEGRACSLDTRAVLAHHPIRLGCGTDGRSAYIDRRRSSERSRATIVREDRIHSRPRLTAQSSSILLTTGRIRPKIKS
jgi:hypothetical protein